MQIRLKVRKKKKKKKDNFNGHCVKSESHRCWTAKLFINQSLTNIFIYN